MNAVGQIQVGVDTHLVGSTEGTSPPGMHWCPAPLIAEAACLGWASDHQCLSSARAGAAADVGGKRRADSGAIADRRSRAPALDHRGHHLETGEDRTALLCRHSARHRKHYGPVVSELQTLVYRDLTSAGHGTNGIVPEPALMASAQAHSVPINEVTLFRYSALTFNSHRIHYDAPYARDVEGYERVVIHGPLQATLLLNHAARLFGRSPSRITIRSVSAAVGALRHN